MFILSKQNLSAHKNLLHNPESRVSTCVYKSETPNLNVENSIYYQSYRGENICMTFYFTCMTILFFVAHSNSTKKLTFFILILIRSDKSLMNVILLSSPSVVIFAFFYFQQNCNQKKHNCFESI